MSGRPRITSALASSDGRLSPNGLPWCPTIVPAGTVGFVRQSAEYVTAG